MKKLSVLLAGLLILNMLSIPAIAQTQTEEITASDSGVLTTNLSAIELESWVADEQNTWESELSSTTIYSTGKGDKESDDVKAKEKVMLLKFTVPQEIQGIQRAELTVCSNSSTTAELAVYRVFDNDWGTPQREKDGTYNLDIETATHCEVTDTPVVDGDYKYYTIDISGIIKRSGTYSLMVKNLNKNRTTFYTEKIGTASRRPMLKLEYDTSAKTEYKDGAASIQRLLASDSGYLTGESGYWNNDGNTTLKAGSNKINGQSFLKFTMPHIEGTVQKATLNLTADNNRTSETAYSVFVYKALDDDWDDDNKPEFADTTTLEKAEYQVAAGGLVNKETIQIDVTDLIDEIETVTFLLSTDYSGDLISFHSARGGKDSTTDFTYYLVERQPSLTIEYTPAERTILSDTTASDETSVTRTVKMINDNVEDIPVLMMGEYDGEKLVSQSIGKFCDGDASYHRDGWIETVTKTLTPTKWDTQLRSFLWELNTLTPMQADKDIARNGSYITEEMLDFDMEGGTAVTPQTFDLTKNTARWSVPSSYDCAMTFNPLNGEIGCWSFKPDLEDTNSGSAQSYNTMTLQPNRTYKISALVRTDFDRANCEINIGAILSDSTGQRDIRTSGVKAKTNGWELFEYSFTTGSTITRGRFYVTAFGFNNAYTEDTLTDDLFCISKAEVVELPETEMTALEKGSGMVFGGGSGNLDMKITGVEETDAAITVTSTGARYVFDREDNTIRAYQLINEDREVSSWVSSIPLAGLEVLGRSDNEVVIANDDVTFGVQLDGMLLSTVHSSTYEDLTLTLTSVIAGKWNRLSNGNLIAMDEIGGFTVNPVLVAGSGKLAQCEVLTEDLDFNGVENNASFISEEEEGWQIKWTVRQGERIAITTFPPREYDWEKALSGVSLTLTRNFMKYDDIETRLETYRDKYGVTIANMWNFYQRAYGMSYGKDFIPHDNAEFKNSVALVKEKGLTPISYMSLNFFYSENYDEYIEGLEKQRDTYGLEGVYCDSIGASDWLGKYETIRRMREVFKDGVFYLHNTGKAAGMAGGPPVSVPDIFIPALETYADYIYKGENIPSNGTGRGWSYVEYVAGGYNASNAIGRMKGDMWTDSTGAVISDKLQKLYALELTCINNFSRFDAEEDFETAFVEIKKNLLSAYEEWVAGGKQGDFYKDVYYPLAKELVDEAIAEFNLN